MEQTVGVIQYTRR